MNQRQDKRFEMFFEIGVFGQTNPEIFAKNPAAQALLDKILAATSRIDEQFRNQFRGIGESRKSTLDKRNAQTAIQSDISYVIQVAKLVAQTKTVGKISRSSPL